MQVVAQLELQLQKERDRLQSMMDHLSRARQQQQQHQQAPLTKQSPVKSNSCTLRGRPLPGPPSGDPTNGLHHQQHHRMSPSLAALVSATMRGVMNPSGSSHHHLLLHPPTPSNQHHPASSMSHQSQSQSRRRLSEKTNSGSNSGKFSFGLILTVAIVGNVDTDPLRLPYFLVWLILHIVVSVRLNTLCLLIAIPALYRRCRRYPLTQT